MSRLLPPLRSNLARNFLTLFSGSVIAQAIPLVAAPFLSRLFTPDDFGTYEAFVGIAAVLAVLATARYELSIMLPEQDEDAFSLVIAATLLAGAITVCFTGFGLFFHEPLSRLFSIDQGPLFFILTPLLAFWLALIQIGHYWFTRRSRFTGIASRRVVQNGLLTGTQLAAGANGYPTGPWGLIGGAFAGGIAGSLWFYNGIVRDGAPYLPAAARWSSLKRIMRRYYEFPLKNFPAHLLNIVANQLPSILFIALFGPVPAGLYALTRRVLASPLSFLADSFTDVFRQKASEDYQRTGSCRTIFNQTLYATLLFSTPPFLLLLFFGPDLFAFLFGEPWRFAGHYARLLSPMYLLRFVASPLGFVLIIAERQNYYLVWQSILFVATVFSLAVGWHFDSIETALLLFAGSYALLYLFLLWESYRTSAGSVK